MTDFIQDLFHSIFSQNQNVMHMQKILLWRSFTSAHIKITLDNCSSFCFSFHFEFEPTLKLLFSHHAVTQIRRSSTSVTLAAVGRSTARRPTFEPTFVGTQASVPSFAVGLFVANGSHDQTSFSGTREHIQVRRSVSRLWTSLKKASMDEMYLP